MSPPETTVNGVTSHIDRETNTLIDINKTLDNVNKTKFACDVIDECDISNMSYEHINTSVALLCNHDSRFGSVCPPNTMHISNTFVYLPKMYSSPVDNDFLNRGFVYTYDDYQNVDSYNKFEQIAMPCYVDTYILSQNCYKFDNFSASSNYTATWA